MTQTRNCTQIDWAPKLKVNKTGLSGRYWGSPESHLALLNNRMKVWARTLKREVHAVYLAARDPRVPWHVKALAICVAAYALSPVDLLPDFIPVVGYADDWMVVTLGSLAVVLLVPPEIMAKHRAAAARVAGRT
jgi:uncharacterized membrane protein YkvA (DUF1232 family)